MLRFGCTAVPHWKVLEAHDQQTMFDPLMSRRPGLKSRPGNCPTRPIHHQDPHKPLHPWYYHWMPRMLRLLVVLCSQVGPKSKLLTQMAVHGWKHPNFELRVT